GGVILNIDYNLTRNAFERAGVKNFHEMYSQANADDLFSKLETGEIAEDDFYREINRRTGLNIPPGEIEKAWNAMLLNFRENSLQFLDSLQPKYKLFLLSNTNHIHIKAFNKIYHEQKRTKPFNNFFEKAYYSSEIGLRKPNADIYEFVVKENNLDAGKTLFVDDSVQNIEAANNLNMQTILLTPGKYIEDIPL
ncbi:MAG: HAD family hydrolase, partial [Ginsengibacter sp.]